MSTVAAHFSTDCQICGEHLDGIATAQYDGTSQMDGETVHLLHFTPPVECSAGHENEYYITPEVMMIPLN